MFTSTVPSPRSVPALIALGCVGFLASAPAHASEEADAAASTIIVTGQMLPDISSPKSTRPLIDTPQTITVVSAETLRQQNLLTLRDALSTLPGITFGAGEGGGGFGDSINLRGYSANNDITQDGVRDSAQYTRTDTFNLQAIEVYNGANSVFNGSGSVGGTINLVSKTPGPRTATTLSAGIGTDNYYRGTVDTNVRASELIAFRLNAMVHRNDVPGRDVERFRRFGIAPSVTIGIDSPTRLTLSYLHQEDDNVPQYGVPYFVQRGGVPSDADLNGYYGYRNLDTQQIDVDQLTATFTHDFSKNLSVRNLTRYQDVRQFTIASQPQGTFCLSDSGLQPSGAACRSAIAAATASAPAQVAIDVPRGYFLPSGRGVTRDTRNTLMYNQTDLKATFSTFGLVHTLDVGGALTHEQFDLVNGSSLRNADGTDPFDRATALRYQPYISIADPGSVVTGPGSGVYGSNLYTGPVNFIRTGSNRGTLDSYAAYLFDTVALGSGFEVNGGLRYERIDGHSRVRTFQPVTQATLTDLSTSTSDTLFSYRAGLVYKPTARATLYVAYGNSKTPSRASVNGACTVDTCNVKPETALNYEAGVKIDVLEGLQLTAALFRNERSNFRVPSNEPGVPDQVLNGKSRVDGIALGAGGLVTKRITLFANYTYLDSKAVRGVSQFCLANPLTAACAAAIAAAPASGAQLINTPEHSGSFFATYTFPFSLQLGYGLTYQGSYLILNTPAGRVNGTFPKSDDFVIHRLFASYEVAKNAVVQLNVQNLTDDRSLTRIRNNVNGWATPNDGRSATLSLSYSF